MTSKYVHQQITSPRSIRVLTLLPCRSYEAPLYGTFSEHDLDLSTSTSFEALSYVWGSVENPGTITIVKHVLHGRTETAQLSITSNCALALKRLRFRFRPRRIWVDAICIAQDSVHEKNEQVALMVDVYYKAKQVLVWLQVENEEEARTREVSRLIKLVGWFRRKGYLRVDDHTNDLNLPQSPLTRACENHRIWTVQEIAMAHQITVYYGAASFKWVDFVTCASTFIHNSGQLDKPRFSMETMAIYSRILHGLETHFAAADPDTVVALHDKRNQGTIAEKLEGVESGYIPVFRSKGLDATEPKDLAYAMRWFLRGLKSSDLATPFHNIDYTKSLETVYTEYTITLMDSWLDFMPILPLVNSTPRNPLLPSWVPDWNEMTTRSYYLWAFDLESYKSSKTSRPSGNCGKFELIGKNLLAVWGIDHSKVTAVMRLNRDDNRDTKKYSLNYDPVLIKYLQFARVLRDVINASRALFSMDDESLIKALHGVIAVENGGRAYTARYAEPPVIEFPIFNLLTLLIDHTLSSPETQHVKEALCLFLPEDVINRAFHATREMLGQRDTPLFLDLMFELLSTKSSLVKWVTFGAIIHPDKDFFITESGDIGMAYHGVQEGDLVAIWKGFPCPMVVRKKDVDDMQAYHFHGPAYVDGIMNGEAWPDTEEGLQEFILV